MSKKKLKTIFNPQKPLSAAELLRLHAGTLSPDEQRRHELQLADDVFAQEALEGLEGLTEEKINTLLPRQWPQPGRQEYAPVISIFKKPVWQAAIAASVLLLVGTYVWQLQLNNEQETLSEATSAPEQNTSEYEAPAEQLLPDYDAYDELTETAPSTAKTPPGKTEKKRSLALTPDAPSKNDFTQETEQYISNSEIVAAVKPDEAPVPTKSITGAGLSKPNPQALLPEPTMLKMIALVETGNISNPTPEPMPGQKSESTRQHKKLSAPRKESMHDADMEEKAYPNQSGLSVAQTGYMAEEEMRRQALALYKSKKIPEALAAVEQGRQEWTLFLKALLLSDLGKEEAYREILLNLSQTTRDSTLQTAITELIGK